MNGHKILPPRKRSSQHQQSVNKMISRREIISRSLDNLDMIPNVEEEEDVWYNKEKLFRDHINEVLSKWEQIDDEIWAKVIVFEKNRRVAKAYARSSVITINGGRNGFDGVRIGLSGFENPMRDADTKLAKKTVGEGFKVKMDDIGNILIKRYGKSNVFVHNTSMANEETVIGADIQQMPNMALTAGTSAKLFDMRKYTTNINREFSRSYPESRRLERQCLSAISLVKSNNNLINNPLWILVINIVAIDMLKNRLQTLPKSVDAMGMRVPTAGSEDPYSTIESQVGLIYPTPAASDDSNNSNNSSNNSSQSSKGRRSAFNAGFLEESPYVPKPDYEIYNQTVPMISPQQKLKSEQRKKQDDPYYCGLLARIPNFIKTSKKSTAKKESKISRKISASQQQIIEPQPAQPLPIATFHQFAAHQPVYYPYKFLNARHHRLSQSQLSLWDARSLISAHE